LTNSVHAFPGDEAQARRLSESLGVPLLPVDHHVFPDGESLITVKPAQGAVALYRSLDQPDCKLMPLLLAADALRRAGAQRVVLVAPYMAYLRQDAVFKPGQALSRDVLGRLLGERFDAVVTVEPHLHRTRDLSPIFCGIPVVALSAAAPLAEALLPMRQNALVIGPDAEAEAWTAALARTLGARHLSISKVRQGDRRVELTWPEADQVAAHAVILADDICSTGATLEAALRHLSRMDPASIDVVVAHALFDGATEARLRKAGARRLISTDSCPHPTNAAPLADMMAQALKELA
jgi:ribose-phosphate pyrophosphokinase